MKLSEYSPLSWKANLGLTCALVDQRTVIVNREHVGPLLIQRALYPEGERVCQIIILHPPGGIAGGDQLAITCLVKAHAHVQLTTPGATKWYEGFGEPSRQEINITVESEGVCEWLPQENIVFNNALVNMSTNVSVELDGVFVGWEFTALGRHSELSPFAEGELGQVMRIDYNGRPVYIDRLRLLPDSFFDGPALLDEFRSFGLMVVVGPSLEKEMIDKLRIISETVDHCSVTERDGVLIARWLGLDIENGRDVFTKMWALLRPVYTTKNAVIPRIWKT